MRHRAPSSVHRSGLRPTALACLGLFGLAAAALAQADAPAQPPAGDRKLDTVTVTGFRASLESSISAKRNNDSIVETISAEDIGKLPDVSIADAISRLPGLTMQRVGGSANVISIRGMAPRYGVTLFNGREMVSTGDNRSVEFDQFPSELITRAAVYKTPEASLSAQGLSGTVNMQSLKPLDYGRRQVVIGARLERNDNGKLNPEVSANGNRLNASYVNQFAGRTLGVAVGFAHLESPSQEQHYKSWWWTKPAIAIPGTPDDAIALQGMELGVASRERKRDGLLAVLEWKPNAAFHSTLDLYYSRFEQTEARRTVMGDLTRAAGTTYQSVETTMVDGNKIITGGTISGFKPVALTSFNQRKDNIRAIGWNNALTLADWRLVADLNYAMAKRNEQNAELQAGFSAPISLGPSAIETGDGRSVFHPTVDFSDTRSILLRDPTNWGRDGRSQFPRVKDDIKTIKLSAARRFDNSWLNSVETGATFSERNKSMNRTEVYYYLKNNRAPTAVPTELLREPVDLGFAGSSIRMLAFDFQGALNSLYTTAAAAVDQAPGRIWTVKEEVSAAYARAGFDFHWGVPVHGNVGVRVVHSHQSSNGMLWNSVTRTPVKTTGGTSYTDTLPNFNLVMDLTPKTLLRFAAAKVIARPNVEDMRAGYSGITVNNTSKMWQGNGGNVNLEPWRADAVDLSLEHYFSKRSYFAVAAFHKNLKNFVYSRVIDFDFTGFPNNTTNVPVSNIGNLTTQANGGGGMVAGTEFSGTLDGSLLTPALDGIGIQIGYSNTRSTLHEGNDVKKPLDGLSGSATNFTLYYERSGFSARFGSRHRSPFVTTVRGTFGENVASRISGETVMDAQLGYRFDDGAFKGLSLTLQVNNLNDRSYRTRVGISSGSVNPDATLPERYTTYGRQFLVGANYRF
ncbi:TonB-dependent receptor [Roseateles asaccharophilus]|uniref:Iron complex outermembrane receptor protein n=1 Tax=Roseateles asaccharophilus TaxID=582607 RepID=A0ABU2A7A0_9BURK|nr:TonB-dependent receptor [Roseateles asaccharophilus]MDR7332885.1 iron complex outermembrane receptor protein [Roseateles asaccharophilus]